EDGAAGGEHTEQESGEHGGPSLQEGAQVGLLFHGGHSFLLGSSTGAGVPTGVGVPTGALSCTASGRASGASVAARMVSPPSSEVAARARGTQCTSAPARRRAATATVPAMVSARRMLNTVACLPHTA